MLESTRFQQNALQSLCLAVSKYAAIQQQENGLSVGTYEILMSLIIFMKICDKSGLGQSCGAGLFCHYSIVAKICFVICIFFPLCWCLGTLERYIPGTSNLVLLKQVLA